MKKEFKHTLNDWKLFYSDSTHNKIFEASKLKVNNSNVRCKPDCILVNRKKNQFLIIERKFTYVPVEKILKPKWSSAEGQLWCYSWIDELAKANKVFLVMELYRPLRSNYQKNKYLLPLDQVFIWDRDNRIHHNKCLQMFKRYGGDFN